MAPRFYFDLVGPFETIRDELGAESDTFERAVEYGLTSIEQMKAQGELEGLESGWTLVVRDATGLLQHHLPIGPGRSAE